MIRAIAREERLLGAGCLPETEPYSLQGSYSSDVVRGIDVEKVAPIGRL
jgi:hypothetical protein